MDKIEKCKLMKWLYFNKPRARAPLFEQFFDLFGFNNHWVCEKYGRYLSEIDLKGNFIIALDEFLRTDPAEEVFVASFDACFAKQCRICMEMYRGLGYSIKKHMVRSRHPNFKNQDRAKINNMRCVFGLSSIQYNSMRLYYEQELDLINNTVKDYLVKLYGEETYNDFISHYIYGESFEDISYYNNDGITRQGMYKRLKRVWETLKEYFNDRAEVVKGARGNRTGD